MNLQKKSSQENDVQLPNPPSDSISSLSVNGSLQTPSNMLIATSWDNSVTCYEIQSNPQGTISNIIMQGQIKHDAPALCSTISTDNITAFSGGCDGTLRMWNVTQGPTAAQVVGKHDAPIRNVNYLQDKNVCITGSWDKTVKVWDLRQPNPAASMTFNERVYAMDAKGQAMVVGTADGQIHVIDLNAFNKISEFKSPLAYQLRCISIFADTAGFALGCIEGRIALEYFDELANKGITNSLTKPATKNFAFKCHRDGTDIFSVHSIDFHRNNTFCSTGSDGVLSIWDKDARQRLVTFEKLKKQCPITSAKFSPMGNYLFYSASYDWSRGAENNDGKCGNNIYMHQVLPVEVAPKDPKTLRK